MLTEKEKELLDKLTLMAGIELKRYGTCRLAGSSFVHFCLDFSPVMS